MERDWREIGERLDRDCEIDWREIVREIVRVCERDPRLKLPGSKL